MLSYRLALPAFVAVGAASFGIYLYMSLRANLLAPVWMYLALYAGAFLLYVYAAARLTPLLKGWPYLVPALVFIGMAFRLVLVHAPPSISTDIYRYVWDGRLANHDINPFRWTPYDPRLGSLRDARIWEPMEYKAFQTVYMPMSQVVFAATYLISGERLWAYKLVYVLIDGLVMWLLIDVLRRLHRPISNVVWYAWCPLPITEVGIAGHQDVVGIALMLLSISLMTQRKWRLCAIALAAAGLTKGFCLLLLPLFVRRFGSRFAVWASMALVYMGLPLWVFAGAFLHGMKQYLTYVHVNSGLFNSINVLLSYITTFHYDITYRLSDAAILGAVIWSAYTAPKSNTEMVRRSLIVLAVCLLVVPTLFPWYVLWLLPLAAAMRYRPSPAFIALSGTVGLVYTYYVQKMPLWWIPLAEYLPVYILLLFELRIGYWRSPYKAALPGDGTRPNGSNGVTHASASTRLVAEHNAVVD